MIATHFSNGDFLIFLHHHRQKSIILCPLHQYLSRGQFPPPPPPYFTTSAAIAAENTSHHHVLHICKSSRWDSNAESYSTNNNIDEEENEDSIQQLDNNLQEYIDSLWILKVFKAYGVMLPFIIFTMIITTGLKAFLLALALPLGQSTFSYAIQKMLEQKSSNSKPRQKTRTEIKKASYTSRDSSEQKNVKKKVRKSQDSYNDDKDSADQESVSYGGWDEV